MGNHQKTTEQFIKDANLKYNYKFDYSESVYIGIATPLSIICPIHGKFKQQPIHHLKGSYGCTKCYRERNNKQILEKDKFGLLTVLRYLEKGAYECQCQCGKIITAKGDNLRRGNNKTCTSKKCRTQLRYKKLRKLNNDFLTNPWEEDELNGIEITNRKWKQIESGAHNRSLCFNITQNDIIDLFKQQKGMCNLSGIRLVMNPLNARTASLDRIDSNIGYTLNNIQWIHKHINKMKVNYAQDRFIELCCLVSNFHKNKNSVIQNYAFVPYVPTCGLLSYKGELSNKIWKHYIVKKAKARNIKLDITREYAQKIFIQQHGLCALSGIPITLRPFKNPRGDTKGYIHTASLDRIDPTMPYIKGNIQWVHKQINIIKSHYPEEFFLNICTRIAKKHKS